MWCSFMCIASHPTTISEAFLHSICIVPVSLKELLMSRDLRKKEEMKERGREGWRRGKGMRGRSAR